MCQLLIWENTFVLITCSRCLQRKGDERTESLRDVLRNEGSINKSFAEELDVLLVVRPPNAHWLVALNYSRWAWFQNLLSVVTSAISCQVINYKFTCWFITEVRRLDFTRVCHI